LNAVLVSGLLAVDPLRSAEGLADGLIREGNALAEDPLDFPDPVTGPGAGSYSIAVLPDTQNYAKFARNQPIFEGMTDWLLRHRQAWNIQYVLHVGDFVEQNDIEEGGGRGWGDQNSEQQWFSAKRALSRLDGHLPVLYATGNHDYGIRNAEDRRTRFNNYFGLLDNPLVCDGRGEGMWLESAPNSFGATTLENAAYLFQPPFGRRQLILCLEWGPRAAIVQWARDLLQRPEHQEDLAILNVHSFLHDDNQRDGQRQRPGNPHTYGTTNNGDQAGDTSDGEDLWRNLVQPAGQLELVICGHVMGRHIGYRKDPNANGRTVHQILFNAQGLGGGSDERGNGGDGWLRLMTFEGDGRRITTRTFSPFFWGNQQDPWNRHPEHSFRIQLDP
jgi:hypothetical protein